jgi:hypothetical protein
MPQRAAPIPIPKNNIFTEIMDVITPTKPAEIAVVPTTPK